MRLEIDIRALLEQAAAAAGEWITRQLWGAPQALHATIARVTGWRIRSRMVGEGADRRAELTWVRVNDH